MITFKGFDRRYRYKGDRKPDMFEVGDLFVYANGETALVTEVFDGYNGESRWGPQWTLHLIWTPGKGGDVTNQDRDANKHHGVLRTNMFNILDYRHGPWLIPVKK
tara:strand:- start:759 stop:1073 length:315 start_codon:yes stop_codon:yes gene_type:complete